MTKTKTNKFQVAVIGGGPAGMMAAGRAAELSAKTVLIEKNVSLGKKLLLTGKGRCNLAQAEFNLRQLVAAYGKNADWLYSPFSVFGARQTIDFFTNRGLETKIERGKRVFPKSDKAGDVLKTVNNYLKTNKATVFYDSATTKIEKKGHKISRIFCKKKMVIADNYIIAIGGKSYPQTGSTGDGYLWAKQLGHTVIEPKPSLVALKIKEGWLKSLTGLGLKNVELNILKNNEEKQKEFGEMLFTHFGISGPIVLDISRDLGDFGKNINLAIDLKPALNLEVLNKRLERDFQKYQKRQFKNSLDDLLPQRLIPIIVKLSFIAPERPAGSITKNEKERLAKLLKSLVLTPTGNLGFETAIVTRGGVSLKEVDNRTMKSKIIDNLFFAGEVLDIDGPSGGYNLQVAWTTGYLAGQAAAKLVN